MPWRITFVFLIMIVSPNSLQVWESLSISCCRSSIVLVTRAASSAKCISPMTTCQNASLVYSTADIEWVGCCSVVVDCSLHVVMEGGDHTQ